MPKQTLSILMAVMAGSFLTSGCINSHRVAVREPVVAVPTQRVVVMEAPPTAQAEVVGVAPDESHVWVAGYWMRADQRWVWVPGHWEARPRPNVAWVPGHWDKSDTDRGWVWTPGHWE